MDIGVRMDQLKREIGKMIIGKEKEIELMAISLLFNGHILLESVPGTGKTLLAKTFAAAIGGNFSRIQFTPDVLPSDVTGISFFNMKNQEFEIHPGPILANVVLADEVNRATPRTQSSLLEAMEEKQVTIDGHTIPFKEPFMVIATQNPVESQQGTFPLPVAQLDRFFIKMNIGYPLFEDEKRIMRNHRDGFTIEKVEQIFSSIDLQEMKTEIQNISISDDLEEYILSIVTKTRNYPHIELGVSPRGTVALMKAAQGKAFLEGRRFVIPDDVKWITPYVLSHRIFLSTEGLLTKSPEKVIEDLLDSVPVPVETGGKK